MRLTNSFLLLLSLFFFCGKLRFSEIDWFFFYYCLYFLESANDGKSLKAIFFSCYFYYFVFFYSWIMLFSIYIYFYLLFFFVIFVFLILIIF